MMLASYLWTELADLNDWVRQMIPAILDNHQYTTTPLHHQDLSK